MSGVAVPFYVTGGTLRPDAASYVERQADRDLLDGLIKGEFCYVLTSRQMGKSSLMVRTSQKLRERGISVVVLDLTAVGQNVTPEQWYSGLLSRLGTLLQKEDELDQVWWKNDAVGPCQRFFSAIAKVILPGLGAGGRLVVFVDELDMVRSLPFSTDEFFAAIRECYTRRAQEAQFNQLTFCLLGVATPTDLIRDMRLTPFNIGRRIELRDFTPQEAMPLALGLSRLCGQGGQEQDSGESRSMAEWSSDTAMEIRGGSTPHTPGPLPPGTVEALLQRIFYWTNGHPYLTQRLCRAAAEANSRWGDGELPIHNPRAIDRLCEDLFLSNRARERDDNLLFVRERLLRSGVEMAPLLKLYDRIRNFDEVPDDESDAAINALRLSGITRLDQGVLKVRNRIYERVFDHDWVMANMPVIGGTGVTALAVLPFVDQSAEPLNDYWTDGLAEELINALGKVAGLSVASWSSARKLKSKAENLREIAKRLQVEVVLEGVVQRNGDRVRISVELVNAVDGYRLWAETFNFRINDLLAVQHELTSAMVARLKYGLKGPPELRNIRPATDNIEAYNLYLKGRFYWNKRQVEPVRRSVELFLEAIGKDPQFALAYAGLADACNILGAYSYDPPSQAYPRAKEAALKALEMDDNLAQAHAALGCVSAIFDWNWSQAEAEFKRAMELNPSYAAAHQWYAINFLTPFGRHQESIKELRKAQAVDPLSLSVQVSLALAFFYAREYPAALEQSRLIIELEESFWLTHLFLVWVYEQMKEYEKAIAACERASELGKHDPICLTALGHVYAVAGHSKKARRLLEKVLRLSASQYVPASEIAILYSVLGDTDQALTWLRKAETERSLRLIYLKVEPRLDSLRHDPRFQESLERTGLNRALS